MSVVDAPVLQRDARQHVTIVVPVYSEARNLSELHRRVCAALDGCDVRWDVTYVNDGSPDDSLNVLEALCARDHRVTILDLSRNFGKEVALSAGVCESDSDAVICLDADLQHPPELIPQLIARWREGAEVVVTIRRSIENQPLMRRVGSRGFYWLMSRFSDVEMSSQTTDFRLYDRKVVDAFRRVTERRRMFRGIMDWMGFRRSVVEFDAPARVAGAPGYTYAKLAGLAINGITSFSLVPLRVTGYLGLAIFLGSSALLAFMLVMRFVLGEPMFTSIAFVVVANTLLIGIVLMAIGLVAVYVGNIHTEVANRPLYIVRERFGGKPARCDETAARMTAER